MQIHYLEIVTPDVQATCECYAKLYDIEFSQNIAELGDAKIAELDNGGIIGVRAPMYESEQPIVRPYMLTNNIEQAVADAQEQGCTIAHPPMEISNRGTFAIYIQGDIHHGLWQL